MIHHVYILIDPDLHGAERHWVREGRRVEEVQEEGDGEVWGQQELPGWEGYCSEHRD